MILADWLKAATARLAGAGIGTARLDCLVLLEDCIGRDRAHLLAHPEIELKDEQLSVLDEQIRRRSEHVPLAYIRGKTEFYGRNFLVNEYVLEPRPESETMIDMLKRVIRHEPPHTIVDVGTGSGALAVTAKLELPHAQVIAIDIDRHCLRLAEKNAAALKADIKILEGDLLAPIAGQPPESYALLCNLPYVPDNFHINQAAAHEPRLAIFGGPDGLDVYRELFAQIDRLATKPMYVLTESIPPQHEVLADIAAEHGYKERHHDDFIQVFVPGT